MSLDQSTASKRSSSRWARRVLRPTTVGQTPSRTRATCGQAGQQRRCGGCGVGLCLPCYRWRWGLCERCRRIPAPDDGAGVVPLDDGGFGSRDLTGHGMSANGIAGAGPRPDDLANPDGPVMIPQYTRRWASRRSTARKPSGGDEVLLSGDNQVRVFGALVCPSAVVSSSNLVAALASGAEATTSVAVTAPGQFPRVHRCAGLVRLCLKEEA